MDDLFDNIGETMVELQADPPAPTSTKRVQQYTERLKNKIAMLKGELQPEDLTPLELLLRIMRDPSQPESRRIKAAALALPYVHAKAGADDDPQLGKKEKRQIAANEIATNSKYAPAPTPLKLITNNND